MSKPATANVLYKEYDVTKPAKKFVIGYVGGEQGDIETMLAFFDAVMRMGYKIKVVANDAMKQGFFDLEARDKKRCTVIDTTNADDKIWQKVDVMVFGENTSKEMIQKCAENGVVPITPEGGLIEDFNPQKESGTGFTFEEGNFWQMVDALVRAAENRKFSYDWGNIKKSLKKLV